MTARDSDRSTPCRARQLDVGVGAKTKSIARLIAFKKTGFPLADKMRWLRSSAQRSGCPIVHGALMRDSPCQRHSLILMHWCAALMRGKVCAGYKSRINFDLDDTTKCIYT